MSKKSLKILFGAVFFLSLAGVSLLIYNAQRMVIQFPELEYMDKTIQQQMIQNIKQEKFILFCSDQDIYGPYERIGIKLALMDKDTKKFVTNITPKLEVTDSNGNILKNIIDQDSFAMNFDQEIYAFSYFLYLKDVRYRGNIIAKVFYTVKDKIYTNEISIMIQDFDDYIVLPKAQVFLNIDSKELLSFRKILSTNGMEADFSKLPEWFDMLGVDTIVMPAAITKAYNAGKDIWDSDKLRESKTVARTFRAKNQDIALWVQALEIDGVDTDKYDYLFVESLDMVEYNRIISIKDKNRKNQLTDVLKGLAQQKYVQYIGMSKTFNKVNDKIIEKELEKEFCTNNLDTNTISLWQEYQSVEYFRNIIDSFPHDKPVFFSFNGEELFANPEYIDMAFAAKADFLFIDIKSSISNIDIQLKEINRYGSLDKYKDRIIFSYCLNYNNVVLGNKGAVDNWIDQSLTLYNQFNSPSISIKDLYRAMFGNRGSYLAYEWMLSIGELIRRWKQYNNINLLKLDITADTEFISNNFVFSIVYNNNSSDKLTDIKTSILPLISVDGQVEIIEIKKLESQESFGTNIFLSNVQFNNSLLKQKTRYIGFYTEYASSLSKTKQEKTIYLMSFIDPAIERDYNLASESEFNEQIRLLQKREKQAAEERQRALDLSNKMLLLLQQQQSNDMEEQANNQEEEPEEKSKKKRGINLKKEDNKDKK